MTLKEKLLATIRQANASCTMEGRAVAEIVADRVGEGDDERMIVAVLNEVIGWATAFKLACK